MYVTIFVLVFLFFTFPCPCSGLALFCLSYFFFVCDLCLILNNVICNEHGIRIEYVRICEMAGREEGATI